MNKIRIEESIEYAYDFLKNSEIVDKDKNAIDNVYRGYISSFGASTVTGNLLSAIAFFSKKEEEKKEKEDKDYRSELMKVIFEVLKKHKFEKYKKEVTESNLFDYARSRYKNLSDRNRVKEEILDYAIAVKLAMNLFVIVKKEKRN